MKLEQHILKVLYEQLLTEQASSGWQISIKANADRKSSKINKIAKDAGAELGFLVRARRVLDSAKMGWEAVNKIRQDVIDILKNTPNALGTNHQFDTVKFMYVLFPIGDINRKNYFKNRGELIGLVIDRTDINNIIKAAENQTYNKYYDVGNVYDKILYDELGNIKILNDIEYYDLITQIQQLKQDVPVLSKSIDQAKLPNINSIKSSVKGIQIPDPVTNNSNIRPVKTSWGRFTQAQVYTVPQSGETRIIPIEGSISVVVREVDESKGIFAGIFGSNGAPNQGEDWFARTNALGQSIRSNKFISTDNWPDSYVNGLKPGTSEKNAAIYAKGTFNGTMYYRNDNINDPSFNYYLQKGEKHYNEDYIKNYFDYEQIKKYFPNEQSYHVISEGSWDKNKKLTGVAYIVINQKDKYPWLTYKNGNSTYHPEWKERETKILQVSVKKQFDLIKNKTFKYPFTDKHVVDMKFPETSKLYLSNKYVYFVWHDGQVYKTPQTDFEREYKEATITDNGTFLEYSFYADKNNNVWNSKLVNIDDENIPAQLKQQVKTNNDNIVKKLNDNSTWPIKKSEKRLNAFNIISNVELDGNTVYFKADFGKTSNLVSIKNLLIYSLPKDEFITIYTKGTLEGLYSAVKSQFPENDYKTWDKNTNMPKKIHDSLHKLKFKSGVTDITLYQIKPEIDASIKFKKDGSVEDRDEVWKGNFRTFKYPKGKGGKWPVSAFSDIKWISFGPSRNKIQRTEYINVSFKMSGKEHGTKLSDTTKQKFLIATSDFDLE